MIGAALSSRKRVGSALVSHGGVGGALSLNRRSSVMKANKRIRDTLILKRVGVSLGANERDGSTLKA